MKAFYIHNHSSSDGHVADVAALPSISVRPKFADKPAFAKWCHDSSTRHVFYSLAEPEQTSLRASATNPIKRLHGIVADYDGDAGAIQAALPKLVFSSGLAPTWVTTTFSSKARLIWCFERGCPVFSADVLRRFTTLLSRDLGLKKLLPGLDEGALIDNPYTPFELGTEWRQPFGDVRVPHHVVLAALQEASDKAKWKTSGPTIPLEAVAAEVQRRWPGRWVGPFEPGARGTRFWDPKADNPTGCTIREEGVQAWTGECKFIAWAELLGAEWVARFQQNRIGGAVEGVHFDGGDYWVRSVRGHWECVTQEHVRRALKVDHGLSGESKKGAASEVDRALTTIERVQRVDGAFPCLFLRETLVESGNQLFLNISRVRVTRGTGTPTPWGEGFPWLDNYLTTLFTGPQKLGEPGCQLDVLLSWLARFYQGAANGKPRKGQALFIAGRHSAGKTFLSTKVIGELMGGFEEATNYVLGNSQFNEQLWTAGVWSVDDALVSSDAKRHMAYSQMVKKLVANPHQEYHPKFKKAVTFKFHGRLVVTLNDDPESIRMLPNIEGSMLDKVIFLRANRSRIDFTDAEDIAASELPAFADFVSGYRIPEWLRSRPDEVVRYGMDSWHQQDLMELARDNSDTYALFELLTKWRIDYFRTTDKPEWRGTASDLVQLIMASEATRPSAAGVADRPVTLSRGMRALINQQTPWISAGRQNNLRVYTIARAEGGGA